MADLRRPYRGFLVSLLLGAVAVVEFQNVIQIFKSQSRLQERAVAAAKQSISQVRGQIEASFASGDPEAGRRALVVAQAATGASEADLFDATGRLLLALPGPSGSPLHDNLTGLEPGNVFAAGPRIGRASGIAAYAAFRSEGGTVVLRLLTPAPDLVADLRDREKALAGHAAALLALAIALALYWAPSREEPASPKALEVYAEAMGRLGERGRALSAAHEAERQRLRSVLDNREAMARAGELTSGIVHELRNGLGTIVGYGRLLEKEGMSEDAQQAARGILAECQTLEAVIRRFTEFVKNESLKPVDFDLGRLLSRISGREGRSQPGATLVLPAGECGTLRGDEELLERAFENLVRNAREAAGPTGHVWIEVLREGGLVSVIISDDGPGMSPALSEGIRPFFTTKPGGLGLGLPIVHKIVSLHGGELRFENRPPTGLRVVVGLPPASGDVTKSNG